MRLVSLSSHEDYVLGVIVDDQVFELPSDRQWPSSMRELAGAGRSAVNSIRSWAQGRTGGGRPLAECRLGPPIPNPGKIVVIARNYPGHTAEASVVNPPAPLVISKFPTSVIGPDDVIAWDRALTDSVDYEAELGVVIGTRARNVSEQEALDHVFGYTCLNDVSARDLQTDDVQWVRAKSLDTFCPVGPWIVTADEIPDPQDLSIVCLLNGITVQDSTTRSMIFGIRELIAHCSQAFTLEPGDLIATGTPAGVGKYAKPPRLLRDGDEVIVRIDGIGDLANVCRTTGAPRAAHFA